MFWQVQKVVDLVKAKGGKVTREPGPVKGGKSIIAFVEDPDGYKFELIQRSATPEPLCQVMLRVGDLDRAVQFYEKVELSPSWSFIGPLYICMCKIYTLVKSKTRASFSSIGKETSNGILTKMIGWRVHFVECLPKADVCPREGVSSRAHIFILLNMAHQFNEVVCMCLGLWNEGISQTGQSWSEGKTHHSMRGNHRRLCFVDCTVLSWNLSFLTHLTWPHSTRLQWWAMVTMKWKRLSWN